MEQDNMTHTEKVNSFFDDININNKNKTFPESIYLTDN